MPSYAEQYRDRWAGGPISELRRGMKRWKFLCISSTLLHHHARRITNPREMGWKCFREREKRCHWEDLGCMVKFLLGRGALKVRSNIKERQSPREQSPHPALFQHLYFLISTSLFQFRFLSGSLHLLTVSPSLNVHLTIILSPSPSFLYLSIYE